MIGNNNATIDATLTNLGVTFFTKQQVTAQPTTFSPHTLLTLSQCDASTGFDKYAVLTIITPENPKLNTSDAYVVVEISNVANKFNSTTIIGCNYYFNSNGEISQIYNNITWIYPDQNQQIWIRVASVGRVVPVTFQLTYTDYASQQLGKWDSRVFGNTVYESGPYVQSFSQFIRLQSKGSVAINNYNYYYFQFCGYELADNNYQAVVTVTSDSASPLSAFDVLFCPKKDFNDYTDCNLNSFNVVYKNQCACSVATIAFPNDDTSNELEQGAYIAVIGEGSPADNNNQYTLTISLTN